MQISIQTLGTRGDVQPYLALGLGLARAGHDVVLAAPARFEAFVMGHGLAFAPLPDDLLDLMDAPEGRAAMAGRVNPLAMTRLVRRIRPMMRGLFEAQWAAAGGAEAILYHPKAVASTAIAERLRIPALLGFPLPGMTPTRAFPSPMLPFADLGPLNALSHRLFLRYGDRLFAKPLARFREEVLGLSGPAGPGAVPVARLYGVSPVVVPRPGDWDADSHLTGYWFLDEAPGWRPDPALAAFLEAGPALVYVGFGSIPSLDPAATTALVIEALARAGLRGVLATGWGGLAQADAAHVHMLDAAPHAGLFPLMAAVVHHGGAGTTAAGLRAGRPSLILPFFGDQPFWGRQVARLGAGPAPIPQAGLTVENLARALGEVARDPGMARRAGAIGVRVRAEDGVGRAVALIERYAAR
ncbi:glycosyltransferase [Salinarimonas soli]|uniref:Glycosyltransferase family 1 protein n=1 Tax=Salinarimonas soli TaxID=1638099 RepID=A0A5B2VR52_9HYPH|nr:glycosyltransferase [Salinarimonas soli]KAA2242253.1 glycosyltransferase family 1 protein [Salinarimonas soli]